MAQCAADGEVKQPDEAPAEQASWRLDQRHRDGTPVPVVSDVPVRAARAVNPSTPRRARPGLAGQVGAEPGVRQRRYLIESARFLEEV